MVLFGVFLLGVFRVLFLVFFGVSSSAIRAFSLSSISSFSLSLGALLVRFLLLVGLLLVMLLFDVVLKVKLVVFEKFVFVKVVKKKKKKSNIFRIASSLENLEDVVENKILLLKVKIVKGKLKGKNLKSFLYDNFVVVVKKDGGFLLKLNFLLKVKDSSVGNALRAELKISI